MANDTGPISDGYHTFDELYEHCSWLFIALMRSYPWISWYSLKHDDGSMFEGMFIVGMNLPNGQVTYHLELEPYYAFLEMYPEIVCLLRAPVWDAHASDDVITKLRDWSALMSHRKVSKDNA